MKFIIYDYCKLNEQNVTELPHCCDTFVCTEIIRVGDNKKVHHVELMPSEQLLAVISGRNRHVRLVPMVGLDGRDTDSFKLLETKGCQLLASGKPRHGAHTCLCVAMKRQVICYELNKSKVRHQRLREIQVNTIMLCCVCFFFLCACVCKMLEFARLVMAQFLKL